MLVGPAMAARRFVGVPSKLPVACVLVRGENRDLGEMRLKVGRSYPCLKRSDLGNRSVQQLRSDGLGGEQAVQLALLVNQGPTERTGSCLHGREERLGSSALF